MSTCVSVCTDIGVFSRALVGSCFNYFSHVTASAHLSFGLGVSSEGIEQSWVEK